MTKSVIRLGVPLLALALALALASPCRADDSDKDKPINFSSDTGDVNNVAGSGELVGNVTITQGTLVLHADRITFKRNADNSLSAIAYGNPVSYRQKEENSDEYDEAYAERIAYDGQKQLVELFVRALLKQGPTKELRSDYISYDRARGLAAAGPSPGAAQAGAPASRVTGVILPKDINSAQKAGDDKSKGAADKAKSSKGDNAKANAGSADAKAAAPTPGASKPGATAPAPPAPLPLTIDDELKSK